MSMAAALELRDREEKKAEPTQEPAPPPDPTSTPSRLRCIAWICLAITFIYVCAMGASIAGSWKHAVQERTRTCKQCAGFVLYPRWTTETSIGFFGDWNGGEPLAPIDFHRFHLSTSQEEQRYYEANDQHWENAVFLWMRRCWKREDPSTAAAREASFTQRWQAWRNSGGRAGPFRSTLESSLDYEMDRCACRHPREISVNQVSVNQVVVEYYTFFHTCVGRGGGHSTRRDSRHIHEPDSLTWYPSAGFWQEEAEKQRCRSSFLASLTEKCERLRSL